MKAKTISKRVLSVILCTVMLFSCWVFTAPTQANAQDAGNYNVRVSITVTGTNNIKQAYQGFESAKGDSAGVTVRCLKNNGVSDTTTDLNWDIGQKGGNQIGKKGSYTLTGTAAGFPAYLYLYLCDDWPLSGVGYKVTKLEVKGTSESSYTTLWSGTMQVTSKTNGYGGWIRYDGHVKGYDHGLKNADEGSKGDDNNYINTGDKTGWIANFPYRSSGGAVSASNITLDGTNSKTSAFTIGDAKDQYSVNYATSNLDSTAMSTPSYNSSYITYSGDSGNPARTITATKDAHIWNDSVNSQNVSVTAYWKTRNTTNTMAKTTTSKTISITDEKYTYTWNWKETNTSNLDSPTDKSTTETPYYGDTPSIPSTATAKTAYYTSAKHWSGGSYTTPARASAAKTYTMSYSTNGEAHDYTYSDITNDHTYHKGTCSCGYALSTTFKHTYGAPTITFAANGKTATASRTCTTDGCNHTQTITANVTSAVKTAATCNAKGITTYTATATFTQVNEETALTVTDTKDVDDIQIVDTAHNWTNTKKYPRTPAKCGEDATYWKECSHNTNHKAETLDATQYWTDENTALAHEYSDPTMFTGKETTSLGKEYDGNAYHKQTCGSTLCNGGADCNGEDAVKYGGHIWSIWGYTVPEDDGTRVIGIVLDQLDGFDGKEKCYRYCTACGYVELSAKHNITSSVTKAATCTEAGITTYTCTICGYKDIKEGIPAATGHHWARWKGCSEEKVSGLNDSVNVIFECTNGCNSYCKSTYNPTTQEYEYDTSVIVDDPTSESLANDDPIITPIFNEHMEYFDGQMEPPYQYADRKASLRVRPSERGEDTQAMRFSGNISAYSIAEKVSFEVNPDKIYDNNELMSLAEIRAKNKADKTAFDDDTVIDFGFVYTQAKYIRSAQKTINYDLLTLDYMGKKNPTTNQDCRIYRMSVVENNKGNGTLSNNWKGLTDCYNYPTEKAGEPDQYTFNLVINVNVKNYQATYCARTYIIYKYHGDIICVYDQPELNETPIHSHDSVYNQAIKNEATGKLPETVVDYLDYKIINRTIEGKERYIKQSFIDWDWNYKLTNFKEIEQQNP